MPSPLRLLALALPIAVAPLTSQTGFRASAGVVSATFTQKLNGVRQDDDIGSRSGLVIGVGWSMRIGASLEFAPGLLHAARGGKDPDGSANVKFTYLEMPLLLRRTIALGPSAHPFLALGPVVAYQLSCTYTNTGGDAASCDDFFGEAASYAALDLGVMAAAGVTYDRLGLDVRYAVGLRDIAKAAEYDSKNRALYLMASYAF